MCTSILICIYSIIIVFFILKQVLSYWNVRSFLWYLRNAYAFLAFFLVCSPYSSTKWQAGYKLYASSRRCLFLFETQPPHILGALWLVGGVLAPSLVLARITASCISWIAFKQHLCIFNVTAEMMRRQPRFPIPPFASFCWQRVCGLVQCRLTCPSIPHHLTPWLMHFAVSRKFHSRFTEANKTDNSSKSLDNVPGICVGSAHHAWYIGWIMHIFRQGN